MEFSHYAPLWGEALLTILAVLVVLLGSLMKNSGKLMGYLSAAGLVAALALVASNLTIKPTLFFFDTISVDALSQFFKVVFLVVSLLVVIASMSKYTGKGADEYLRTAALCHRGHDGGLQLHRHRHPVRGLRAGQPVHLCPGGL